MWAVCSCKEAIYPIVTRSERVYPADRILPIWCCKPLFHSCMHVAWGHFFLRCCWVPGVKLQLRNEAGKYKRRHCCLCALFHTTHRHTAQTEHSPLTPANQLCLSSKLIFSNCEVISLLPFQTLWLRPLHIKKTHCPKNYAGSSDAEWHTILAIFTHGQALIIPT